MSGGALFAFIAVSTAVIVIPGPSILLIVATALRDGIRAGFFTVAGISAAMVIQLAIAVAGLTSLITQVAVGQRLIRWVGIAYLTWLGIRRWRGAGAQPAAGVAPRPRQGTAFGEGFLVSLTNPTTMLFFVAFFPQFLTGTVSPQAELVLMALTFWLLALGFDCAYAALAAKIGKALHETRSSVIRDRAAGVILLVAALALALARVRDAA
ncbi:MAG: LysE family translocator [Chromatiales bacterium]|nr:MAG: LysE family translocator [Chromatiales bacterium]